ncbi:MAG: hypothetical protein R3250_14765, partial [Melioribacteraceae bacterium]|nr:hypothetical protein [Melioribacteraceae bacterium]
AAGQFVLYNLTSDPHLFDAYFAISPNLDWDNNLPQRSLEESFIKADSLKAFLYFAWSDDLGKPLEDNLKLAHTIKNKAPKGFRSFNNSFPDETHGSVTLLAQIEALRKLFANYRLHNDLFIKGLNYAEKHFQNVSEIVGYEIPVPEDILNSFGYQELNNNNIQMAIAIFERNVKQNPNSANAFDSLTDAYENAKMLNKAMKSAEKAVDLAKKYNNPNCEYFINHAKEIKNKLDSAKPNKALE